MRRLTVKIPNITGTYYKNNNGILCTSSINIDISPKLEVNNIIGVISENGEKRGFRPYLFDYNGMSLLFSVIDECNKMADIDDPKKES